jgi:regulator of sirC expression with transglutaminase-like and TPR domain
MVANADAIARLLNDDDPGTVRLVKEQLAAMGEDHPHLLMELANNGDESLAHLAGEVLAGINSRCANDDFSLLCHFGGGNFDIEHAVWMLCRALHPELSTDQYEEQVNQWGREFLSRVSCASSSVDRIEYLAEFLFGELHFRGNSDCYYCEANSLLPHVIESRKGIPISLSLVYSMVAARAGMKVEGINLPGHFIVRHGEVYFDPFHGGRILTHRDIIQILSRQGIEFKESHLQPASPRQFLTRILANLLYVFDLDGDYDRHARVKDWMSAISCAVAVR